MAAGGGRPPGPDSSLEPYVQTRIFKIIVIGDSNVGKTCLTFRFCGGTFPDKTEATIGVDFREKTVEIEGERIKVQVWDTAGQERFRKSMVEHYYRNVHAVVFVYDVTKMTSFTNLKMWIEECNGHAVSPLVPKVLVGNKCDLKDLIQVPSSMALKFADAHNMLLFETSAKDPKESQNVESIFMCLACRLKAQKSLLYRDVEKRPGRAQKLEQSREAHVRAVAAIMNPLTKVKLINELNAREAELGVSEAVSWHAEYKDSAWVFIGGLPYQLTEGDVICVFSQYGEVVNINLVRDKKTGKSKGFCFLCYEDQRSTVLAVDNFNGIKIKGRTIRVDHVANYRPPKDSDDLDDVTKALHAKGCGVRTPPHTSSDSSLEDDDTPVQKQKDKEKSKRDRQKQSSQTAKRAASAEEAHPRIKIKKEKEDPGYDRYAGGSQQSCSESERKHASRTQRDEEEQRHRRSLGRRGEKSTQEHRGQNGSREERGEVSRKGEGHGSRREECPEGSRSRHRWESSTREPHSKHRERGSTRDSSHH